MGFVVSKAVGPAVVRNRVKRQLRHLTRDRLAGLLSGSLVVVRANPTAAGATSLAADLDSALASLLRQELLRPELLPQESSSVRKELSIHGSADREQGAL